MSINARNMYKKFLSLLLCLVLIVSVVPNLIFCSAAEDSELTTGKCGDNLTYSFDSSTGTLTISGKGNMTDWETVMSVPWFEIKNEIITVIIENGVTGIGEFAFENCDNMTKVTIPNSVISIGVGAFEGCDSITSIEIPDSVISIRYSAFRNCDNLISVTLPKHLKKIEHTTFYNCINLTSIVIPSGVETIGQESFERCTNLSNIDIPDSVTEIGFGAFRYCHSLKDIIIPDSVTKIGSYAFVDCDSLENISTNNKNPNYSSDNGVLYNKSKTKIIQYPIGSTRKEFVIPNGVETIGEFAFQGCDSLINIIIPDSVTTIIINAFNNCINLANVYYLGTDSQWSEINIGSNNEDLTNANIHFSESDLNITYYSFNSNTGTMTISLDRNFATHVDDAGYDFIKLHEGFLKHSVWAYNGYLIGYGVKCNPEDYPNGISEEQADKLLRKIITEEYEPKLNEFLEKNGIELTQSQFNAIISFMFNFGSNCFNGQTGFEDITEMLLTGAENYTEEEIKEIFILYCQAGGSVNQGLFERRKAEAALFVSQGLTIENKKLNEIPYELTQKVKNIVIKKGVTSIDSNAFSEYKNLEEVSIPDSVKTIAVNAFENTKLLEENKGTVNGMTLEEFCKKIGISNYERFGDCSTKAYYLGTKDVFKNDTKLTDDMILTDDWAKLSFGFTNGDLAYDIHSNLKSLADLYNRRLDIYKNVYGNNPFNFFYASMPTMYCFGFSSISMLLCQDDIIGNDNWQYENTSVIPDYFKTSELTLKELIEKMQVAQFSEKSWDSVKNLLSKKSIINDICVFCTDGIKDIQDELNNNHPVRINIQSIMPLFDHSVVAYKVTAEENINNKIVEKNDFDTENTDVYGYRIYVYDCDFLPSDNAPYIHIFNDRGWKGEFIQNSDKMISKRNLDKIEYQKVASIADIYNDLGELEYEGFSALFVDSDDFSVTVDKNTYILEGNVLINENDPNDIIYPIQNTNGTSLVSYVSHTLQDTNNQNDTSQEQNENSFESSDITDKHWFYLPAYKKCTVNNHSEKNKKFTAEVYSNNFAKSVATEAEQVSFEIVNKNNDNYSQYSVAYHSSTGAEASSSNVSIPFAGNNIADMNISISNTKEEGEISTQSENNNSDFSIISMSDTKLAEYTGSVNRNSFRTYGSTPQLNIEIAKNQNYGKIFNLRDNNGETHYYFYPDEGYQIEKIVSEDSNGLKAQKYLIGNSFVWDGKNNLNLKVYFEKTSEKKITEMNYSETKTISVLPIDLPDGATIKWKSNNKAVEFIPNGWNCTVKATDSGTAKITLSIECKNKADSMSFDIEEIKVNRNNNINNSSKDGSDDQVKMNPLVSFFVKIKNFFVSFFKRKN